MIRPFTCLTVLLAAGSGLYLYSEKHRTTLLDDRIRSIVENTHQIEDRTSMLRAEWALLNQPDRLRILAAKFLPQLAPMAPTQFVQESDLDKHLPPVGPPKELYGPPVPPTMAPGASVALASAVVGKPAEAPMAKAVIRVAARVHRREPVRRAVYASSVPRAAPLVRQVASYAPPAPMLAGAWHTVPPAPAFTGSALGMAHTAMPPPMASR